MGSQHKVPSIALDHWSQLVSAPVPLSSCLARGCKVAFAGDLLLPSAGMVPPSLAWGHTEEVPAACGSVPCMSPGRIGATGGAGRGWQPGRVLRHKAVPGDTRKQGSS